MSIKKYNFKTHRYRRDAAYSKRIWHIGVILFISLFSSMSICTAAIKYEVLKPISAEKVLYDTNIRNEGGPIRVCAAAGEYEPASLLLKSNVNIPNVGIHVTDLLSTNGIIFSSNVDIRVVKIWYQGGGAWDTKYYKEKKRPAVVPELLLKDESIIKVDHVRKMNFLRLSYLDNERYVSISNRNIEKKRIIHAISDFPIKDAAVLQPITLRKNESKQLWITIKIPSQAAPGLYKGEIYVSDEKSRFLTIPIKVKVLSFKLKAPKLEYSIFYRGKLYNGPGTISSEYKNRDQLKAELVNIIDHGISNPVVFQLNRNSQDPPLKSHEQQMSWLQDYLSIRKDVGIIGRPLYLAKVTGNTISEQKLFKLSNYTTSLLEIVKRYDVTSLYLYGKDEARSRELVSQKKAWFQVREAGAKIFATGYKNYYEPMAKMTDLLVWHGKPSIEDARKIHALGNRVFSYHNPQSGPENPYLFRKNYGLLLWQNEYDGAMVYAYQHSGGVGSIWNDFDSTPTRDHNFTYPTVNGVIDTIAWEGMREAVDDVRYITTLEATIEAARKVKNEQVQAQTKLAHDYLEKLKVEKVGDLDLMRKKIVENIERLKELIEKYGVWEKLVAY